METIQINHRSIIVRTNLRSKHLRLQVRMGSHDVILTKPKWITNVQVKTFLHSRIDWIEEHCKKMDEEIKKHPLPTYHSGDVYYYLGEPYTLVIRANDKKRPSIRLHNMQMVVRLYHGLKNTEGQDMVKKTIEQFYKKKATEITHDRLQHFSYLHGFSYNRVTLKNQKTRWGSCSSSGNLNFNWRLSMAPIEVIDYVIVHELCHLKQMNHSSRFWSLVESILPNYKETRKWLAENQYLLRV